MSEVAKLHDDEVDTDASLVARLLAEQFPQWAGAAVQVVESSGTDNVTFRVGADLAVRLPRTERTQGQVEKDLTWMPRLSPRLPLAVPEPLALGAPGAGYPFSWGVYRWLEGEPFQRDQLADPMAAARELAEFVRCLQTVDTTGAPVPPDDPFSRGTPLAPRDALFREALAELRDEFDTGLVLAAWEASLAADTWDGPPRWIHGDLMAATCWWPTASFLRSSTSVPRGPPTRQVISWPLGTCLRVPHDGPFVTRWMSTRTPGPAPAAGSCPWK